MDKIVAFLEEQFKLGYKRDGSVFKADYTGKRWTLGFWLRPVDWDNAKEEYRLPGICVRVRHENFNQAVNDLLKEAKNG